MYTTEKLIGILVRDITKAGNPLPKSEVRKRINEIIEFECYRRDVLIAKRIDALTKSITI